MEWVETTGKTVEAAKAAALDQLGVAESDADVIVVTEARSSLFGLRRGEARVRARVQPVVPRQKRGGSGGRNRQEADRRQRRGGARGAQRGDGSERAATEAAQAVGGEAVVATKRGGSKQPPRPRREEERSTKGHANTPSNVSVAAQAGGTVGGEDEADLQAASGRRRGGRGGTRDGSAGVEKVAEEKEVEMSDAVPIEEQAEHARKFVAGLLEEMGLSGQVAVTALDEATVEIKVEGEGLGILVGRSGTTISALQELTRSAVQAATGGRSDRILVDVAGYRQRRAEALRKFAAQVAAEVLEQGEERRLEPMNASDRKVVHDSVGEIEGVGTRSEGEEPHRFVVIFPQGE